MSDELGVGGLFERVIGASEAASEGRRRRPKGRIVIAVIASIAFPIPIEPALADNKTTQSTQQEADKPLLTPREWAETDAAIDRALTWLARNQQPDGGWPGPGGYRADAAVASLAVMAFLSRGHQPDRGPYGRAIGRAIDYVVERQRPNGALGSGIWETYNHGISSLMLAEVLGMCAGDRNRRVRDALKRAINASLAAQRAIKHVPLSDGEA